MALIHANTKAVLELEESISIHRSGVIYALHLQCKFLFEMAQSNKHQKYIYGTLIQNSTALDKFLPTE